jgi:hypothetical protein
MISLLYLHVLGEAVDVADIPVMIVVGHVEGWQFARGSDLATRGGGGATQCHSLSICQPDGAPLMVSLGARGSPPLKRVDHIPWSAWIASHGARGSRPLKRVDRLPSERVDRLPDDLPRDAWIASLRARGSSAWITSLGERITSFGARESPP